MGAFDFGYYKLGLDGRNDDRLAQAIISIKEELIYNGYDAGIDLTVKAYGGAVKEQVAKFQTSVGLKPDGVCGPTTLLELFRPRVVEVETRYNLPHGTLGKKIKLESGYDPVAIGVLDPSDTGIAQINLGIHTSVTKAQAFDPKFALDWAGKYVRSQYEQIATDANLIKAARAAYNIGNYYARLWMLAGFPATGGPNLGGTDVYERATKYIALIDKQQW